MSAHPLAILIENDLPTSQLIAESLQTAGFGVIESADGEDGLRIIEQDRERIDVVVAEAAMPGVGAREISEVLAQYRPELPVVVVSGALAAGDPRNSERLITELRASIERVAELTRKLVRTCETVPQVLMETRRVRAESADLIAAVRAIRARRSLPSCPSCASTRVASILYGRERLNRREDLAAGRVVLGGVSRGRDAPDWYCRDCDHRWRD